jgi:hypothetical protein
MTNSDDDFIGHDALLRMRDAAEQYPETEHTHVGGWCKHCGCGNDVLGYGHLPSCTRPKP